MKKSVLISVVLLLTSITIKAQWNQFFTGVNDSRTVSVINDTVAWINGPKSSNFSITTDGGKTWITKNLPTEISAASGALPGVLSAVSATTAFIVGNDFGSANGIYKTTDSGNTWIKQTTAFNQNSPFPDFVYFWNENDGVAVGDAAPTNFEIYTTNNGGSQWNLVPSSNMPPGNSESTTNDRSSAFRVNGEIIYFLSSRGNTHRIFKSSNKGLNWTAVNTPIAPIGSTWTSFDFKNENQGLLTYYSYATGDKLYSTIDGGAKLDIDKHY